MLEQITKYPLPIKSTSNEVLTEVRSPYSGKVIAQVAIADEKIIMEAIGISLSTFHNSQSKLPAYERAKILSRLASLVEENKEDLAQTIALEGGKPIKDARIEVSRAINTISVAAEETLRLYGEQLPMDRVAGHENRLGLIIREPLGVIAGITPFNFPLNLVCHKVAPALACGNTVVLKPASSTPLACLKLRELAIKAGLDPNAFLVLPCPGKVGSALVKDPRISMLTFTGSGEVGWNLKSQIAPGTRLVLELGGNAGLIVHKDADLQAAVLAAARGGYGHAGQTCISVQRVYVHKSLFDKFVKDFTATVQALKVGDPTNDDTDMGPLIDSNALEKTLNFIEDARLNGANIVYGGKEAGNNCLEPAIIINTKPSMHVICQEVFGPVVSVVAYENIDDAIYQMNDSRYGLQAGVFTQDIDLAFKVAKALDVGGVMINDGPSFRADHMPYGGRKESGLGIEGVRYAMHEMSQPKFICLNLKSPNI